MRLVCYVTYEDEDKQDTSKRDIYLVIQLCKLINHMNEVAPNPFTYREEGKRVFSEATIPMFLAFLALAGADFYVRRFFSLCA